MRRFRQQRDQQRVTIKDPPSTPHAAAGKSSTSKSSARRPPTITMMTSPRPPTSSSQRGAVRSANDSSASFIPTPRRYNVSVKRSANADHTVCIRYRTAGLNNQTRYAVGLRAYTTPDSAASTWRQSLRISPVSCNGLNSIRATQTDLSRSCHVLCPSQHVETV